MTSLIVGTWHRLNVLMRGYDSSPRPAPRQFRSLLEEDCAEFADVVTYRKPPKSDAELLKDDVKRLRVELVAAQDVLVERVDRLAFILALTGGAAATTWVLVLLHVWGVI